MEVVRRVGLARCVKLDLLCVLRDSFIVCGTLSQQNKHIGYISIGVAAHLRICTRAMNTQELHFSLMQWLLPLCPTISMGA